MALCEESGDQTIEKEHLAGLGHEALVRGFVVLPWPVEVMRTVAGKTKLHYWILKLLRGDLSLCLWSVLSHEVNVYFKVTY